MTSLTDGDQTVTSHHIWQPNRASGKARHPIFVLSDGATDGMDLTAMQAQEFRCLGVLICCGNRGTVGTGKIRTA